jgi:hypothetical protein
MYKHDGPDFQSRVDKSSAQAEQMKKERCGLSNGRSGKFSNSSFYLILMN